MVCRAFLGRGWGSSLGAGASVAVIGDQRRRDGRRATMTRLPPVKWTSPAGLVVAGVRRRHLVRIAPPGRVGRVAGGELPRREVRARRRDALLELLHVET